MNSSSLLTRFARNAFKRSVESLEACSTLAGGRSSIGAPLLPRRNINYVYSLDPDRRHVQFEVDAREKEALGLPADPPDSAESPRALGFAKGGFRLEKRMRDAVKLKLKPIETPDEIARVKKAMAELDGSDLDPENIVAPNCVDAAGRLMCALHGIDSFVQKGERVPGHQLAQRYMSWRWKRDKQLDREPPVPEWDSANVFTMFHIHRTPPAPANPEAGSADPALFFPSDQHD